MTDSTSGTNFPFQFSSLVRRDKAPSSSTFFLSVVLATSYDGHESFYPSPKYILRVRSTSKYAIKRDMLVERGKFRTTEKYFLEWSVDDEMKAVFGWGLGTGVVFAQKLFERSEFLIDTSQKIGKLTKSTEDSFHSVIHTPLHSTWFTYNCYTESHTPQPVDLTPIPQLLPYTPKYVNSRASFHLDSMWYTKHWKVDTK